MYYDTDKDTTHKKMLTLDLSKENKINCIQGPVWAWQHNKSRQCNEKNTSVLLGIKSESADDKLKVITT